MKKVSPIALSTINDRLKTSDRDLNVNSYFSPTSKEPIYGLVQMMLSERNFLTDDKPHPRLENFTQMSGFFGTSHISSYMLKAAKLLEFVHNGFAAYTGTVELSTADLSLIDLAEDIIKDPTVVANIHPSEDVSAKLERLKSDIKYGFSYSDDNGIPMTTERLEFLEAYVSDYRDYILDYLSDLLQMSRDDVWGSLGEIVTMEYETRNLVLRVNGGYLRQQPRLVFEAA